MRKVWLVLLTLAVAVTFLGCSGDDEPTVDLGSVVWPKTPPEQWATTPDELALNFAQHIAMGNAVAFPRPAVQTGMTATAELPKIGEDGEPFGLATTLNLQAFELGGDTLVWAVASAQSEEIVIDFPATGELLAGGTFIRGQGRGFEGAFSFRIEDQLGLLGTALAQGGALGENLPFEAHVLFDQRPASGVWAVVTGYSSSEVDGSLSALTMIPTRLVDRS